MSGSLINIDDIESYEWYLDSADLNNLYTEFKNVKVSLKENYKLSDIALKFEEISSYKTFHNENIVNLIWIFHQLRINIGDRDKNHKIFENISKFISLMENNENLVIKKKDKLSNILKKNFSVISILVEEIKKITNDIRPSLSKCLSNEDKNKIVMKLSNYESYEESEEMLNIEKTDQYKILEKFNKYPILHKYIKQINNLTDIALSDDENSPIAKAAILYLIDDDDVIPDGYGIMGLIDDIYAIDLAVKNINPDEFSNLVDIHDALYPEFTLPTFGTIKNPLSTLGYETICKVSYTKLEEDKNLKRHIVLRDVGIVPVLVGMGRSIVDRIEKSHSTHKNEINFSFGDHIIVGTKKLKASEKPIVAAYRGQFDDEYHFIEGKSSKGNEKKAIKLSFLSECSVTNIKELSSFNDIDKCIRNGFGETSLWKNINFPKNIEKKKSKGKVFFFGDKREFQEIFEQKIFDKSIKSWFGLVTIGQNFEKSSVEMFSNTIFPEPQFYHIYDEINARNILLNNWGEIKENLKAEPALIISSNENFHKNEDFIRELSLSQYDIVAFSDIYQQDSKTFSNYSFDTKYISPNKFSYQVKGMSKLDPIEGFINRGFEFDINFEILDSFELNHFTNVKRMIKAIKKDFPQIIIVLKKFLFDIQRRLTPSSETYYGDIREKFTEIRNELEFLAKNDNDYEKIYAYVKSNFESILSSNRLPYIKNFITDQKKDKKIIFLSPSNQVSRLSSQLADFPNVIVTDFNSIQSLGDKDILIIPFYFGRINSRKLRNNRYASEHVFFSDIDESNWIKTLIEKDKKAFENYFGNRDDISVDYLDEEANNAENELEFYSSYDKSLISEISKKLASYKNIDKIDSNLIILDEGMRYILPWGGKTLAVKANNSNNSIDYVDVNTLGQGDKLIIPESNISGQEILDVIIKENKEINIEYEKSKSEAFIWRDLLKKYVADNNLEIPDIIKLLATNNINRKKDTIINWLNRNDIVAPQNRRNVIPVIFRLCGIFDEILINRCIDSCEKLIRLRQDSLNHLKKNLISLDIMKFDKTEIEIKINKVFFKFNIFETLDVKKIANNPSFLYKLYSDDDLNKLAKTNEGII